MSNKNNESINKMVFEEIHINYIDAINFYIK